MNTHFTALLALAAASLIGSAQAVGVSGQGDWETTLQPRDLDGNAVNGPEAFYDTALDITWLRNVQASGGFMGWASSNSWANSLVVNGIGGWRLPTMVDTAAPGCDFAYNGTDCGFNVQTATSEMAHLFYVTLGNRAGYDTSGNEAAPGWGLTNTGNFQNLETAYSLEFWTDLAYAPNSANAWYFGFFNGGQSYNLKAATPYSMAVHTGDVSAVPEPQTYALMLMGLSAQLLARQRRPG